MNIKSLLLGSAAALVAVSGARAADAVVAAEPEPVEYVRVCDMYGTGFFYIPGTETCLKIGGYIRFDVAGGDFLDNSFYASGQEDTYNVLTRFTLRTDVRNETEFGTLRTYTETRFNYANGGNGAGNFSTSPNSIPVDTDGDGQFDQLVPGEGTSDTFDVDDTGVSLNFAWIELAGFRVGKGESAFTVFPGYAGNVISDDIISYGPFDTNFAQYEADFGGGFSGIISVEEGADTDELFSYIPHVVGGLKYDGGLFGIAGVVGYDANNEEVAGKVRVDIKPSETFYGFVMAGYKTDDGDIETHQGNVSDGTNFYGGWNGDNDNDDDDDGYAVWAGASYVFSPKLTLNGQVSYDQAEDFAAVVNLNFQPVPGLSIQPEINYVTNFDDDFDTINLSGDDGDADGDDDAVGFVLRFQRDF